MKKIICFSDFENVFHYVLKIGNFYSLGIQIVANKFYFVP